MRSFVLGGGTQPTQSGQSRVFWRLDAWHEYDHLHTEASQNVGIRLPISNLRLVSHFGNCTLQRRSIGPTACGVVREAKRQSQPGPKITDCGHLSVHSPHVKCFMID